MRALALLATLIAALVAAAPATATFPGRNGAIAYVQDSGTDELDPQATDRHALMVQPPGGALVQTLFECVLSYGVPSSGDCSIVHIESPAYSPDGRLIAFDAGRQIAIVSTSGGPVTLLSAQSDDDGHPAFVPRAWAPGAPRISFTAKNDRGGTDILARRVDGRGDVGLLRYDATEPAWSARGDFAFVRDGNVYLRSHDNPHHRFVTSGISPDWSPDGKRLVVVRPRPNLVFAAPFGRLYTVRPNGRGLRLVRGTSTYAGHPVWSPDGHWIAYDGLDRDIYAKRLGRGGGLRQVARTQHGGANYLDSYQPTWRARR
jgi:Tol biopolymer transport system component